MCKLQSLRNRTYDHYAAIYYLLLEKLKQQQSQENSSHYLQDRRLSEKLFSYEQPQLFTGHSSPNKRASIDCPAGHQYLQPDLWKQPKTSAAVHLNSGHAPSNRPRSYSQGRAVQHSVNLADLCKSPQQQHPPFRELPQLPKFKGGKPDKIDMAPHDDVPKMCYHNRLDHMTAMAPQYSTSTDEGIETDLEDAAASCSPTQMSHRSAYPPASGGGPVIKSHSQNLADHLQCAANLQQYESDLQVSSLPSCANDMKYAVDCAAIMQAAAVAAAANSCPPPLWDRRASFLAHNHSSAGDGVRPRNDNMSPVSFREGRRASDGLMNQIDSAAVMAAAVVAVANAVQSSSSPRSPQLQQYNGRMPVGGNGKMFQLQECGVQREHETLKMLYQSCLPNDEQVASNRKQAAAAEYRCGNKDVPPRSPSASMAKRFNYTDGYALDKSGLQQQLLQQRLLQHKRTALHKQGAAASAAAFGQCSATAASDSPANKRQHHAHRQSSLQYNNKTVQMSSPQHGVGGVGGGGDGHGSTQFQSDGSWQSLPHTMATCQINDFEGQANWLSVPDPQHHWYCTSGQQYNFSKNYSQVTIYCILS